MESTRGYLDFFKRAERLLCDSFLRYLHEEKVFILDHIKESWTILEVGCGFGRIVKEIAVKVGKRGKVLGIDIDDVALKETKKLRDVLINFEVLKMNGVRMGFKPGVFDCAILAWNILGNLEGLKRIPLIEEIKRILKPVGILIGSVYSEYSVLAQMEQYMLVGSKKVEYHPKCIERPFEGFKSERFSKEELKNLFIRAKGFKIKELCKIAPIAYGFLLEKE